MAIMLTTVMDLRNARQLAAVCGCVFLSAIGRPAAAQWERPLRAGERVRVTHTDPCCASPQVGALVSVDSHSVVLRVTGPASPLTLRRAAVRSVERGIATDSYAVRGSVVGLLVGAIAGAGIGHAMADCRGAGPGDGCLQPLTAVVAGGIGALGGLLVGAVIGASVPRWEWLPEPLPARVGLTPAYRGGPAILLALRL